MVPSGLLLCNSLGKQEIYLFSYVLYVFPLTKKIGLCDGHLIQTKMHFKLQTGNLRNLDNNSCWLHCQSEEKVQFMSVTYDWQSLWGLKISLLNYVTEPCIEESRAAFWKVITALKSQKTCYNLNLNLFFTNLSCKEL